MPKRIELIGNPVVPKDEKQIVKAILESDGINSTDNELNFATDMIKILEDNGYKKLPNDESLYLSCKFVRKSPNCKQAWEKARNDGVMSLLQKVKTNSLYFKTRKYKDINLRAYLLVVATVKGAGFDSISDFFSYDEKMIGSDFFSAMRFCLWNLESIRDVMYPWYSDNIVIALKALKGEIDIKGKNNYLTKHTKPISGVLCADHYAEIRSTAWCKERGIDGITGFVIEAAREIYLNKYRDENKDVINSVNSLLCEIGYRGYRVKSYLLEETLYIYKHGFYYNVKDEQDTISRLLLKRVKGPETVTSTASMYCKTENIQSIVEISTIRETAEKYFKKTTIRNCVKAFALIAIKRAGLLDEVIKKGDLKNEQQ